MLTSPSSSYLDLRAPNAQRIKRKPPPTIDIAERYPSPDPSDPFAPLWVLRNRTSSALLDHISPYAGVYGSQETLENPSERRRSMSYMDPSPLSLNASTTLNDTRWASISPSPSPLPNTRSRPEPTGKIGHYMRYSQIHAASATKLQAFPRIATPNASQTDVSTPIASPKRTAGLYNPTRSSTPDDADLSDYYGMESDTTASSTSEILFRPNTSPPRYAAGPSLVYPKPFGGPRTNLDWQYAAGSISTFPTNKPQAESKLKLHSQCSAARAESAHLRFTKFLIPKKRPSLLGSTSMGSTSKTSNSTGVGSAAATQIMAINEQQRATEPRKVHKSSISAPQAVMSTVAWDPPTPLRNVAPHPQPAPRVVQHQKSAVLISTVIQGQDKENKKAVAASPGTITLIRRSISLDVPTANDGQKHLHLQIPAPSPWTNLHTKPNPVERPLLINVNDNIHDGVCPDHHRTKKLAGIHCEFGGTADLSEPGLRVFQEQIKGHKVPPPRNDTPVPVQGQGPGQSFTTLQPISGTIKKMERSTSPALQARLETVLRNNGNTMKPRHSRMFSFPPISLSPVPLSARSISGTSIVNISLPSSPTNFEWQHEEEEAYTSPRPAPSPPPLTDSASTSTEKPKATTLGRTTPSPPAPCCAGPHSSESQSPCCAPPGATVTASASSPSCEWGLPTEEQIRRAAMLQLTCEDGTHVSFGSLFAAHRTIVVFIRHFWCPLCQDYMSSLKALVQPEMLSRWSEAADVRGRLVSFVVISNGAYGMIRKYRRIFGLPFNVYTDPALAVYKTFGMGRDGDDGHRHLPGQQGLSAQQIPRTLSEKVPKAKKEKCKRGGYVKHGLMGGIAMVVVRAIKVGMPVWEKGGDIGQLGGEFIFGPGLMCSFAHRMQTTKGHAPIEDVLEAAGIDISGLAGRTSSNRAEEEDLRSTLSSTPAPAAGRGGRQRHESMRTVRETLIMRRRSGAAKQQDERRFSTVGGPIMTREEEEEWMAERQRQIERLQERKNVRRGTPSRAASALSSYAYLDRVHDEAQMAPAILEAVGELSDERAESEGQRESFDSSTGNMSEDEKTVEQESVAEEEHARVRAPSMVETASCYSSPSGGDEDDRDFIFMETETEDDSWKVEDERNIQPTTSYLFIH